MPPRNSFKTNASFFRMLALGAVGAQTVQQHLNELGHRIIELERGALSTKIWRDVKRKRVRIPDLCCTACGVRIESRAKSRAKTPPDLRMSHSTGDAERAWDYGMLDSDWVAFPILSLEQDVRDMGALESRRSLWRERILTSWAGSGHINVFRVSDLRNAPFTQLGQKGVSEGSEIQIKWNARFAAEDGRITGVRAGRVHYTTANAPDKPRYYRLDAAEHAFLEAGRQFRRHQVVAGQVAPLGLDECRCGQGCGRRRIEEMLRSRERTSRFTGCKLARLKAIEDIADTIRDLAQDTAEDPYVRMEARSYLCNVVDESAERWFRHALLDHPDDQTRLETAVALSETRTASAFGLLRLVFEDRQQPTFLRSACAWAIGCHRTHEAAECLVRAFADIAPGIREEALVALENLGEYHLDALIAGLGSQSSDIAAGSAEAIRRVRDVPGKQVSRIVELAENSESTWPAWALAHLPKEDVRPYIAALQDRRADIHYALSVLWTFLESWVAEDWTPRWTA